MKEKFFIFKKCLHCEMKCKKEFNINLNPKNIKVYCKKYKKIVSEE
jgi:hypothetical protein